MKEDMLSGVSKREQDPADLKYAGQAHHEIHQIQPAMPWSCLGDPPQALECDGF